NRYETARPEDSIKGSWSVRAGNAWRTMIVAVERDTSVRMVVGGDTLRATGVRFEAPRLRFALPHGAAPAEAFDVSAQDELLEGTMAIGESSRPVNGRRQPDPETRPKDAHRKDEPLP